MDLKRWLRFWLFGTATPHFLVPSTERYDHCSRPRRSLFRPGIEVLEDRNVPAAVLYATVDGGDAYNGFSGDTNPFPGSIVQINPATGQETTIWQGAAGTDDGPRGTGIVVNNNGSVDQNDANHGVFVNGLVYFTGSLGGVAGVYWINPNAAQPVPTLLVADASISGLTVAPNGEIFGSVPISYDSSGDQVPGRIVEIDPVTGSETTIWTGQLAFAGGMVVDSNNGMLVFSAYTGTYVTTVGSSQSGAPSVTQNLVSNIDEINLNYSGAGVSVLIPNATFNTGYVDTNGDLHLFGFSYSGLAGFDTDFVLANPQVIDEFNPPNAQSNVIWQGPGAIYAQNTNIEIASVVEGNGTLLYYGSIGNANPNTVQLYGFYELSPGQATPVLTPLAPLGGTIQFSVVSFQYCMPVAGFVTYSAAPDNPKSPPCEDWSWTI